MPPDAAKPDLKTFHGVDQADDPAALIAFLEASDKVPSIVALKSAMLGELQLGNAKAALDVGCGPGTDVAEMLGSMPPGGTATGLDNSEIMITEARRRSAELGLSAAFTVGDALKMPYDDGTFDACRAETLLQHLTDPQQAVHEMTRVTRAGGRVAALEFDLGTTVVDHPDRETTQLILQRLADDAVQPWMGRQLPRLFRQAGLTDLSVTPAMILANQQVLRMLVARQIDRLQEESVLAPHQVRQWWSQLDQRAAESPLTTGSSAFLVAATKR
jgi:ubiquinone/menaquinone biosynthesis C-methylase UbiE